MKNKNLTDKENFPLTVGPQGPSTLNINDTPGNTWTVQVPKSYKVTLTEQASTKDLINFLNMLGCEVQEWALPEEVKNSPGFNIKEIK